MRCFTVGHSNHPLERFLDLLKLHDVDLVVDVRSSPYSRAVPQYNRETMGPALRSNEIAYEYRGGSLGARHYDEALLFPDGRVDFSKVRQMPAFREAILRVVALIREGRRVALMCSEKEPYDCHRFVLVSYALQKAGVGVDHIMEDGRLVPNSELEVRLGREYPQQDLFAFSGAGERDPLDPMYEKRNRVIAFRARY